jgi:plasmid stabilization system protein ParE
MEKGSHVVFYRKEAGGILVSRVLHKSMLPEAHWFNDDEAENDR